MLLKEPQSKFVFWETQQQVSIIAELCAEKS